MSDERRPGARGMHDDSERVLERLFEHAEPRLAPPADDAEEVRRALYEEWLVVTRRRRWSRRIAALAAVVVGAAILLWATAPIEVPSAAPAVARVERVQGIVGLGLGSELTAGSTVFTGGGQVALRLVSGESLRLAPQTRLELVGPRSVTLVAGAVYFDSEQARGTEPYSIATSLGVVRDVGTQFVVRAATGRVEIGVRGGRVALARGGDEISADAGVRLVASAGSAAVERSSIAVFGDEWAWAERLAPPFEIDGRRLGEFLEWFEQQTGREVVFADLGAERAAQEAVLNGAIDLEPLPKLVAVLTLTDLDYSIDGSRVVVASR